MLVITLQRAGGETCAHPPAASPGTRDIPADQADARAKQPESLSRPGSCGQGGADKDASALPATPHYNAAIMQA